MWLRLKRYQDQIKPFVLSGLVALCLVYKLWNYYDSELTDKSDAEIFYYNKLPRTGSATFIFLMRSLAAKNNFHHVSHPNQETNDKAMDEAAQAQHVRSVAQLKKPISFDRRIGFIRNFAKYSVSKRNPIWFSMVRNPVDQFLSHFYYQRRDSKQLSKKMDEISQTYSGLKAEIQFNSWKNKSADACVLQEEAECKSAGQIIHHFCGISEECSKLGSTQALARATENVEKFYPVVGVLEEFGTTLAVLENYNPRFFKGATKTYYQRLGAPKHSPGGSSNRTSSTFSLKARALLSERLGLELDFYKYLRQRLLSQIV